MTGKKKEMAIVEKQTEIASGIFDMWISTELAKQAKAGQFICIYPENASTLLPRPISICEADPAGNRLRVVYRVAGKGTAEFSGYRKGQKIAVLGTLGNGYPVEKLNENASVKRALLLGGGIGIPPMLQLAKELHCEKEIVLGYRDSGQFLKSDFEPYGTVRTAAEDGSIGTRGNVMTVVKEEKLTADVILACGPMPMLKAIREFAAEAGIPAYISLEERMACGVGACLGCVCRTKEKDHHSHVNNARICTDGPVFEAQEVEI